MKFVLSHSQKCANQLCFSLQTLLSPELFKMNGISVLIHLAGAVNFGYALYYDLMFVHVPPHMRSKGQFSSMAAFPGKWKYLTIWNMVIKLTCQHFVGYVIKDAFTL